MASLHHFDPVWIGEKKEQTYRLISLILQGKSFSAAAAALGVTKNAAVGAYDRARNRGEVDDLLPDPDPKPEITEMRIGCCRFPLWGHGERPTHQYCGEPT